MLFMEEIVEGAFKSVLRLLSLIVRAAVWLILEMFFEVIAWYVGWPIVRLLTLGKYPKDPINGCEEASVFTSVVVAMTGLVFLIALGTVLAKLI